MYKTQVGANIEDAKHILEQAELVAIPTETVYGLAANGLDPQAISRIYEVKKRPQFNPLILHVSGLDQMKKLVLNIPMVFQKLIAHFSPGPITYLLPKSKLVPELVTAGSEMVAVRIPDHPLTLSLLSSLDFPLAAPSANISGYVSPVSASHVLSGLSGLVPYILDGGLCKVGLESTIIGFENKRIQIHRMGAITKEQIELVTGMPVEITLAHENPSAPGQLKSHYATKKPFLLGNVEDLLILHKGKKIGVISFKDSYQSCELAKQLILSPTGDLRIAAANLFSAMRDLDQSDVDMIIAEPVPLEGIGHAINDRLERAAYTD